MPARFWVSPVEDVPSGAAGQVGDLAGLLRALAPYRPTVVGSLPLGVQRPDSDLDIACEAEDLDAFDAHLAACAGPVVVSRWRREEGVAASVAQLRVSGQVVEVFAQGRAVLEQHAFRHLLVEGQLLQVHGAPLRAQVARLKAEGLGTEAAFARALGLETDDPYRALLELEGLADADLRARTSASRRPDELTPRSRA